MDSAITLIMELLGDWMNYLDINTSTGGGGVGVGMTELVAFEDKWDGKMNEVADGIDGVAVFARRRWFWLRMECVDFVEKHIPVRQFQWFIDIVSYLQFFMGETVLTAESQKYEFHAAKVRKKKDQSIFISAFKTDVPNILGGLGEGKE